MVTGVNGRGFDWLGVVYLALILVVIFTPVLFVRRDNSPPSDGRSDDDRGGGPRKPGGPPLGGPPLPDADQSRRRLRDHRRLTDRSTRRRARSLHRPRRRERTAVP